MEKLLANTLTLANTQRKKNILRKHLLKYIPEISTMGKKTLQFVFSANIPPFSEKKVSKLIPLKRKLKEWLTKIEKIRLKIYRILLETEEKHLTQK